MASWIQTSPAILDLLLDPVTRWRPDVAILAVGVGVALLSVLIRLLLGGQALLRRAVADRRRLRALMRLARAQGNTADVRRYRQTWRMIRRRTRRGRWSTTLMSLALLVWVGGWCSGRLAYYAPRPGDTVEVSLVGPADAIGELVHVVPMDGVQADGWIRRMEPNPGPSDREDGSRAVWHLVGTASDHPQMLVFRHETGTWVHDLWIGRQGPMRAIVRHDDRWATQVRLEPVRLLGPAGPARLLGVPGWMIGYVLLVVATGRLLRWVLRIR